MSVHSWDLDGGSNKVEFTQFAVGVTKIRILDDAPLIRWIHWVNNVTKEGKGRSINCPGNRECPICNIIDRQKANKEKATHSSTRRFAMNVINRDLDRVEIMEQGKMFMEDLRDVMEDLKEDGKKLIDADLRVRRRGTGKDDTSYRIDVEDATPLTDDDKKMIDEMTDLKDYFAPHDKDFIMRVLNGEKWEDIYESLQEENDTDDEPDGYSSDNADAESQNEAEPEEEEEIDIEIE